jgi:hypothetical protein
MPVIKPRRLHWQNVPEHLEAKREEKKCPARKSRKKKDSGVSAKEIVFKRILRS